MLITSTARALLFAAVALSSACSLYSSDPSPPDAGQPDEPDADLPELDAAVTPDAADVVQCATACPTQYECADYTCSCVGPLVPEQRCIGTCDETCGDAGYIVTDAGYAMCDVPFTPYRCTL